MKAEWMGSPLVQGENCRAEKTGEKRLGDDDDADNKRLKSW